MNNTPSVASSATIMRFAHCLVPFAAAALAACGGSPTKAPSAEPASSARPAPAPVPSSKYYKDDGPGDDAPANVDSLPDAVPRLEPLHRFADRPYTVLGRDYVPATTLRPYRERGIASWYGRKFHGEKTSIGETYDMYAMTAAHSRRCRCPPTRASPALRRAGVWSCASTIGGRSSTTA